MPLVREVAREACRDGVLQVTQRGRVLGLEEAFRGPIRLKKSGGKL